VARKKNRVLPTAYYATTGAWFVHCESNAKHGRDANEHKEGECMVGGGGGGDKTPDHQTTKKKWKIFKEGEVFMLGGGGGGGGGEYNARR